MQQRGMGWYTRWVGIYSVHAEQTQAAWKPPFRSLPYRPQTGKGEATPSRISTSAGQTRESEIAHLGMGNARAIGEAKQNGVARCGDGRGQCLGKGCVGMGSARVGGCLCGGVEDILPITFNQFHRQLSGLQRSLPRSHGAPCSCSKAAPSAS